MENLNLLRQARSFTWNARFSLRDALATVAATADVTNVLEELHAAAARTGHADDLAAGYAEELASPSSRFETLRPVQRLEASMQVAWWCIEHGYEAGALTAALAALDISPADERALAVSEPLLLEAGAYTEIANRYARASLSALTEQRARQLLDRAVKLLSPLLGAAPALMGLNECLARLGALRSSFPPPLRDSALLEAELHRALNSEEAATQKESRAQLGELFLARGRATEGLALWLPHLNQTTDLSQLDQLERLCEQAEAWADLELVLRHRTELPGEAEDRARSLERLGKFHGDRDMGGERADGELLAAGDCFLALGAGDDAERVYEFLLSRAPKHRDAAVRLLDLRAQAGDFKGVSAAFEVILGSDEHGEHAADVLLELEPIAARVGAAVEFAELAEELLWQFSELKDQRAEHLVRACARLFSRSLLLDEAAEGYRRLVSEYARLADVRDFEALIESHPASDWRRRERRWIFEWLLQRTEDKSALLLEWAEVEEHEWGDPVAALSVLERAMALDSATVALWRQLTHLRLTTGNIEGALGAASQLCALGAEIDTALLTRILEQRPTTRWALERMKVTLSQERRFPELLALYDRALDASSEMASRTSLPPMS